MNAAAQLGQALAGWKGYALVGLVAAAIASGAAWKAQGWRYGAEIADIERDHARARDDQAQATVTAVEAARTEERRRTAAVEKARDDAQKLAAAAADAAAGARAERDGLRIRANSLARAAVARDPAAADGSPAGATAVDLLAYMLGQVSVQAEELAGVADRARIAGLTCEQTYDGIREHQSRAR